MEPVKIIHAADLQVKNRNLSLFSETEKVLNDVAEIIKETEAPIYVISGDLFEYATPNESERKLIYSHIAQILQIPTLKELIIIAGNHDLVKENKQENNQIGYNPINIFTDIIISIGSMKLRYFDKSGIYNSIYDSRINYCVYSLEDRENWSKLKNSEYLSPNRITICLYHAMLREYALVNKLPLQPSVIGKLDTMDIFPNNSYIFAGDIHQHLVFDDNKNNKHFIYPGSTQQHTFGEGSYLTITDDKIDHKWADYKHVFEYQIDDNNQLLMIQHNLPCRVGYHTITLDHKTPYAVIKHYLEILQFPDSTIGTESNNVKIKSSNIFISNENEIFSILHNKLRNSRITFEYDKFIQQTTDVTNKEVQRIIEDKAKEIGFESDQPITADNIDDLLLSDKQLDVLFDTVLNQTIDAVASKLDSDDIDSKVLHDDIIGLFNKELHISAEKASTRYHIKLLNVETNGFMFLGENSIKLDNDGITRILGTNGIGKTTLYRLIRWCITGMAFENMSANQSVKNALVVFNNKDINNNTVIGKLSMIINGQPVTITRTAIRTWKQNITDEDKYSQNWVDFISGVERKFELQLTTRDGEIKTFNGQQAENCIKVWFGNSVQNILFINQAKIEQILRTTPDKLNELVLSMIGVDYLQKLEDNLPNVKDYLMQSVTKPTQTTEQIRTKIIDTKLAIKQVSKEIEDKEKELTDSDSKIKKLNNDKQSVNDKLIKIGNVSQQIETVKLNISDNENELKQLKNTLPDLKEKKQVTLKQPVKDETKLNVIQEEIDKSNKSIKLLQLYIDDNNKTHDNVIKVLNSTIDGYKQLYLDRKQTIDNDYNIAKEDLTKTFNKISSDIRETISKLENKESEKHELLSRVKTDKQLLLDKINSNEQQIKNGVCPVCQRPFDNFTEEHKYKLLDEIENLKKQVNQYDTEIVEINNWFDKFKLIKQEYVGYIEICGKHNVQELIDCKYNTTNYNEHLVNISQQITDYEQQLQNISKCWNVIDKLSMIPNKIYDIDGLNVLEENFQKEINLIINKFKALDNSNTKLQEDIESYKNQIKSNEEIRNQVELEYSTELENYQKHLNEITSYNNSIEENNNKHYKMVADINSFDKQLLIEKQKLSDLEKLLPDYNELTSLIKNIDEEIEGITNGRNQIQKDITSLNVRKNAYENNIELFNKEIDNIIQYKKNNYIWNIYSKLIKNSFKHIVFEYYRTYLNKTLNYLLSDVNFKLFWSKHNDLSMITCKNGQVTYQSVQQSSGMETTFLGLALVYTLHLLNVKNNVSHLFIDEISGTLNKGKELSYNASDYQELFVNILSKFKDIYVWIVDHTITNIGESTVYEVIPTKLNSKYVIRK